MKKQHFVMRAVATILAIILVAGLFNIETKADGSAEDNRMNVVFVMDESGSMVQKGNATDPQGYRYDALKLFLGLATEEGNYFGSVSFDTEIKAYNPLKEINGKREKDVFYTSVENAVTHRGYTNVGAAVKKAADLIEEGANKDYPSVIVLLTDGNTEFENKGDTTSLYAQAEQDKNDAIDYCRRNGIKVYGVCLSPEGVNANEVDSAEVQEYTDATGGKMQVVRKAEDLEGVFQMFYDAIYGTKSNQLIDTVMDDDTLVVPFNVPAVGVEEANIIINTSNVNTTYNLRTPSGIGYTKAEIDAMSTKTKSYTVIKVPKPEAGDWEITVYGKKGDSVTINMVYNSFLEIELQDLTNTNPVKVYSKVSFDATVKNNGTPLSVDQLKENPLHYLLTDATTGEVIEETVLDDGSTAYDIAFPKLGEFIVKVFVESEELYKESNEFRYEVINTAPTSEDGKVIKFITPFSKDAHIDLGDYASDAEQTELNYTIDNSTLKDKTADIDNTELVLTVRKSGSGEVNIIATDDFGESTTFTVKVVTINLLIIIVIVLLLLFLLLVGIILLAKIIDGNKPVVGTIKITGFAYGISSAPETIDGGKGKMPVSLYYSPTVDTGLNLSQCYFFHGKNDNHIYFISKKPLLSDMSPSTPMKKIRLDDQMEISVYSDREMSSGLRLMYKPYNDFGGSMF